MFQDIKNRFYCNVVFSFLTFSIWLGIEPPAAFFTWCGTDVPKAARVVIWEEACHRGYGFPDREHAAIEPFFDGTLYIVYRRMKHDPLPYPDDPVLGWRK